MGATTSATIPTPAEVKAAMLENRIEADRAYFARLAEERRRAYEHARDELMHAKSFPVEIWPCEDHAEALVDSLRGLGYRAKIKVPRYDYDDQCGRSLVVVEGATTSSSTSHPT